jgi:SH3-like domain-containing protein
MRKLMTLLALAGFMATASYSSAQEKKFAVTDYSVNYLRISPDYESALETQELMGIPVEILDSKSYWKKVRTPQPYEAWCTNMGLAMMDENEIKEYMQAPKYICTTLLSKVYSEPCESSLMVSDLVAGDLLRVSISKSKPVKKGKFLEVIMPAGEIGYVLAKDLECFKSWAESRKPDFENIEKTAMQFVGIPYLWGGMSVKGFDCSGFVRYTMFLNGILLPRNASQQSKCGEQIALDPDAPMEERIKNLKPGDLVFFGRKATAEKKEAVTHVGLYLGDGKIIHSSHELRINSLLSGQKDTYSGAERLIRACRVIGEQNKGTGVGFVLNSPTYFPAN